MSGIELAGVSHKTSPLGLREGLHALGVPAGLDRLRVAGWTEAVVLSTCNRFEVYGVRPASASGGPAGEAPVSLDALLENWAGVPLSRHLYRLEGARAAGHLFSVASGLDSLVIGEAEILGQVKQSYESARAAGMTGKLSNVLFQRALYVGKLVRNRTGIGLGRLSVASAAAVLAERIFGGLKGRSVLILGAGRMAELTAKHLLGGRACGLRIANRSWARAAELAGRFNAEPVAWDCFPRLLESVDIVIASTGAASPVLTRPMIESAAAARRGRSLFLIDIAVPRDVEERVQEVERVYLYTMEDLRGIVQENLSRRRGRLDSARLLVSEKASEFESWLSSSGDGFGAGLRHSWRPAEAVAAPS